MLIAMALVCLLPSQGHTALDAMQSRLLQQVDVPWRWDNIERGPLWVRGPQPVYHRVWGMHAVSLAPAQTVTLHFPHGRTLRLYHPVRRLARTDLDIAVSNGSGLRVIFPTQRSRDGHSWLLPPAVDGPVLVHITRAAQHTTVLAVALFISRHEAPGAMAPYRDLLPLSSAAVRLRRAGEPIEQRFWPLTPAAPASVDVRGPARLALETRVVYPATERRTLQTYQVDVSIDGMEPQTLELTASSETKTRLYRNGRPQVLGQLAVGYFDIPSGHHILRFESTAPLYTRLFRQAQTGYLVPALNQPEARPAPRQVLTPSVPLNRSLWRLSEAQIRHILATPAGSAAAQERVALRLRRDNRRREGGLQAAMLLRRAARQQPAYRRLAEAARAARRAFTWYRTLLPTHKTSTAPQFFAWFLTPRLHAPGVKTSRWLAATQHREAYLDQLAGSYFVPLPQQPHKHIYHVPPRTVPSVVRLIVDTTATTAPQEIGLQFDAQAPIRLRLRPGQEMPGTAYAPSRAEIGLALLRRQHAAFDAGTLGGPFSALSARHVPAQLRRTGWITLPLPPDVHRITV